jgi:hypothetical protein
MRCYEVRNTKPRNAQASKFRKLYIERLEDRQLLAGVPGLSHGFGPTVGVELPPTAQSSAISTYVPPPITITPTNPVQTVRVIVLNFEPTVPSMGNQTLWEIFNWNDPRDLAAGFVSDVETASGGAIDYQIVEWRDLNEFPIFTDGFRYTADQYVFNRQTNPPNWWNTNSADFYAIAEQQGLAELVNDNVIDEIWMFGDHFFNLLGEAWMAGPQSFFINGPSFPDFPVDRAVAGFGFSYERGVAEMLHNFGHRTENHMVRTYGAKNSVSPHTPWDFFSMNDGESNLTTFGVGSVHFPPNGTSDYDYANTQTVSSYADGFIMNFPNQTYTAVPITRDAWGDLGIGDWQRGFLRWYFGHMPRGTDTSPIDGRQNNWFKYIIDFNSYRPNPGLPRDNEAILGAPPLTTPGSSHYEFTIRYYDVQGINIGTLDNSDVQVTGPGGFFQWAERVEVESQQTTTSGTARTVRYRVSAPDGTWDAADAGNYSVLLSSNQVFDVNAIPLPAAVLGNFQVNISSPGKLDIESMLATGQAMVDATTWDIGDPEAIFDNSTSSLYRTSNINPAVITLSFSTPQSLTGFRALFSHASGFPAYSWKVEAANSPVDLDNQNGSYEQLVPITPIESDQFSSFTLGSPTTKTHVRLTAQRLMGDNFVHINSWELFGTAVVDSAVPAATMSTAPVVMLGDEATTFVVRYSDDVSVDFRSINFGDIRVTGPNGFTQPAAFYGLDVNASGPLRDATYFVSAPGSVWVGSDNGTYLIHLQPQQVFDTSGKPVAPLLLGSFVVSAPLPEGRPKLDMTELNAADWFAWAQGATASTSNDAAHKTTGAASLRFDTTGGFDTFLRYEPPHGALWNLTHADQFDFDVYAQNPSPSGFQVEPIVRMIDADGDWMEFRYYHNGGPFPLWSDARGQWLSVSIPIKLTDQPATGWRGTANGTLDWTRIRTVEIHADTWDHGFTLWFDRMGFNVPVVPGDFDGDLTIDAADISRFVQAKNEPDNPLLDLDGNGVINFTIGPRGMVTSDFDMLIRVLVDIFDSQGNKIGNGTEYGDADLNGQVSLSDLIRLASNYRQPGLLGWADGNFDGSLQEGTSASPRVSLSDLIILASNWRYGVGSGAAITTDDVVNEARDPVLRANFSATIPAADDGGSSAAAAVIEGDPAATAIERAVRPRPIFATALRAAKRDEALLAWVMAHVDRLNFPSHDDDDDLPNRTGTRASRSANVDEAFDALAIVNWR